MDRPRSAAVQWLRGRQIDLGPGHFRPGHQEEDVHHEDEVDHRRDVETGVIGQRLARHQHVFVERRRRGIGNGAGPASIVSLLNALLRKRTTVLEAFQEARHAGTRESCKLRTRMFRLASMKVKGIAVIRPIAVQIKRDADVEGDLLGLDFFAGADAPERRHHTQDRAEQSQQRTALNDRSHPTEPRVQVGEDVPLHQFGDQLAELRFVQLAVFDGGQGQLRQRAFLRLAKFGGGVEIAVSKCVCTS